MGASQTAHADQCRAAVSRIFLSCGVRRMPAPKHGICSACSSPVGRAAAATSATPLLQRPHLAVALPVALAAHLAAATPPVRTRHEEPR